MKRWQKVLPAALLAVGLLASGLSMQPAQSQEGGTKKVIYLFSTDFPPNAAAQYPAPPAQETKFWQLMDKEVRLTDDLALTENMEDADYRVELRCTGVTTCTKLLVDIKDMERNLLASFTLKHISPLFGLMAPNLNKVAHRLTTRLDERLKMLDQGAYGHTD